MSADDHGSASTYSNWGCRCTPCKEANRVTHRRVLAYLRARRVVAPDSVGHGRASTYTNWGCRCLPCTEAHRVYNLDLRARQRSA